MGWLVLPGRGQAAKNAEVSGPNTCAFCRCGAPELDMYLIQLLSQDTCVHGFKYMLAGPRLNLRRGRASEAKTTSGHDTPAQVLPVFQDGPRRQRLADITCIIVGHRSMGGVS